VGGAVPAMPSPLSLPWLAARPLIRQLISREAVRRRARDGVVYLGVCVCVCVQTDRMHASMMRQRLDDMEHHQACDHAETVLPTLPMMCNTVTDAMNARLMPMTHACERRRKERAAAHHVMAWHAAYCRPNPSTGCKA
jgi:hypothetical protein